MHRLIPARQACDRIAVLKEDGRLGGTAAGPLRHGARAPTTTTTTTTTLSPAFVGSPQHLIFKRGRFIFLSFTVASPAAPQDRRGSQKSNNRANIIRFVRQHVVNAELLQDWGQRLKFKVPLTQTAGAESETSGGFDTRNDFENADVESQTIDSVFRIIERARVAGNTLDILDYKVTNCNLEDVVNL